MCSWEIPRQVEKWMDGQGFGYHEHLLTKLSIGWSYGRNNSEFCGWVSNYPILTAVETTCQLIRALSVISEAKTEDGTLAIPVSSIHVPYINIPLTHTKCNTVKSVPNVVPPLRTISQKSKGGKYFDQSFSRCCNLLPSAYLHSLSHWIQIVVTHIF